jgi:hypothetical protein
LLLMWSCSVQQNGGGARCASDSSFWVQMVKWRKAGDPFPSAKKCAQWVQGWLTAKSKANKVLCRRSALLVVVGRAEGGGVLAGKVCCANGDVAKSR